MFLIQSVIAVYVGAAVLPAVLLFWYIYKQDRYEKEPWPLLRKLLLFGVLAALVAVILEKLGTYLLSVSFSEDHPYYVIVFAFIVVALAEECAKYFLMKAVTWRNPNFNFRFDGIMYAVTTSLGFAAFENLLYVIGYGLSVAPLRAVLSIPGHLSFAVVMGFFYGRARFARNRGMHERAELLQVAAVASSVLLHGFYDACALTNSWLSTVIFVIFVVVLYVSVFFLIRRESRQDRPLW